MNYRSELARYGAADKEDKELLKNADDMVSASLCTLLESQLARSLKKTPAEASASVQKYLALYAVVSKDSVHPLLWEAAQKTQST